MSKKKIYHGVKGERITCNCKKKSIFESLAYHPKFLFTFVVIGVIIAIVIK